MTTEPRGPWAGSIGGEDLPVDQKTRDFYAACLEEAKRTMACPNCGSDCHREEADVGVGIIFGPWGCPCGWSEDDRYNQLDGPTSEGGHRTDQWGWLYADEPAGSAS